MDNVELNKNLQNIDLNIGTADIEMNFETGVQGRQGERGIQGEPGIQGAPGVPGPKGESGVWVGETTPPDDYDVWINPDGTQSTIPTKTSELTNDSNFVSDASYVHTDNNFNSTYKENVDSNTTARHTHANKSVLDGISASDIEKWDSPTVIDLSTYATFDSTTSCNVIKEYLDTTILPQLLASIDLEQYEEGNLVLKKPIILKINFDDGGNSRNVYTVIDILSRAGMSLNDVDDIQISYDLFNGSTITGSYVLLSKPLYFRFVALEDGDPDYENGLSVLQFQFTPDNGITNFWIEYQNYRDNRVGNINSLHTTTKSNLVAAINEVKDAAGYVFTSGASEPSGGNDGDIYLQYEE